MKLFIILLISLQQMGLVTTRPKKPKVLHVLFKLLLLSLHLNGQMFHSDMDQVYGDIRCDIIG